MRGNTGTPTRESLRKSRRTGAGATTLYPDQVNSWPSTDPLVTSVGSFAGIESPGVSDPGWYIFGGTSEATPLFSGIVAMADQLAGHRLGNINPDLYSLGALSQNTNASTGIVDITSGNNTFAGVTGVNAATGYDLASGWGTVDGYKLVHALAEFRSYPPHGAGGL